MALSDRINSAAPNKSNQGCVTCAWLTTLKPADRKAFDDWVAAGHSKSQLHELCSTDPDNPLNISNSGFRFHMKHHEPA